MRPGDAVLYRNGATFRPATVSAVVGAGPSGYKRLALTINAGLTALDVPHEQDATEGHDAWAVFDASRIAGESEPMNGNAITEWQDAESHGFAEDDTPHDD